MHAIRYDVATPYRIVSNRLKCTYKQQWQQTIRSHSPQSSFHTLTRPIHTYICRFDESDSIIMNKWIVNLLKSYANYDFNRAIGYFLPFCSRRNFIAIASLTCCAFRQTENIYRKEKRTGMKWTRIEHRNETKGIARTSTHSCSGSRIVCSSKCIDTNRIK